MDFDEYNAEITRINNELQNIATRTANQTILGSANSENPEFVELMQRHAQLVKVSSELTERMISQIKQTNS